MHHPAPLPCLVDGAPNKEKSKRKTAASVLPLGLLFTASHAPSVLHPPGPKHKATPGEQQPLWAACAPLGQGSAACPAHEAPAAQQGCTALSQPHTKSHNHKHKRVTSLGSSGSQRAAEAPHMHCQKAPPPGPHPIYQPAGKPASKPISWQDGGLHHQQPPPLHGRKPSMQPGSHAASRLGRAQSEMRISAPRSSLTCS